MRSGILSDLAIIGYEISLEGDNIKFCYQKPEDPPDRARQLIDELREHKAEAVNILKTSPSITPMDILEPGTNTKAIWRNPYPQGTPEARQASFDVVIEAMLYGLPPVDAEQTQRINDMVQDILSGKAKLADFRRLLGILH